MVIFEAAGEQYEYVEGWQDVVLAKFIAAQNLLKNKPKKLSELETEQDAEKRKELLDSVTKIEMAEQWHPYMVSYCCIYSNLNRGVAKKLSVKSLEQLYTQIRINLSRYPAAQYTPTIEHADKLWHLPKKAMAGSTVIEFMEAAQFEKHFERLKLGQWAALPDLLTVLLKEDPKEEYNNETAQKRKPLFMSMPMPKAFQVGFFLTKLSERYAIDSAIFTSLNLIQSQKGQA